MMLVFYHNPQTVIDEIASHLTLMGISTVGRHDVGYGRRPRLMPKQTLGILVQIRDSDNFCSFQSSIPPLHQNGMLAC